MAGAPALHNQVCFNTMVPLYRQTAGKRCVVYNSDMRVRPDAHSACFYPDVMLRCGHPLPPDSMEVSDTTLIVEVLSDTTEDFDRHDKFERYKRMPSLQNYVLVSPSRRTIEVFRADQQWSAPLAVPCQDDNCIELGTHGVTLLAGEVFA